MLHTGNVCYCPLKINLLCNLCDLSCSYSYRCIYNDDILLRCSISTKVVFNRKTMEQVTESRRKPIVVGIGELLWDMLPSGKKAGGPRLILSIMRLA